MSQTGSNPPLKSHDDAGFTLIEMLVVLTIVGLCFTLIPPLTRSQSERANLKMTISAITAEARAARQKAIREQHEVLLAFGSTGFRQLPDGKDHRFPERTTAQLSVRRAQDADPTITFYPDGTSSGGRISVVSGSLAKTVTVSWPFGQVAHD